MPRWVGGRLYFQGQEVCRKCVEACRECSITMIPPRSWTHGGAHWVDRCACRKEGTPETADCYCCGRNIRTAFEPFSLKSEGYYCRECVVAGCDDTDPGDENTPCKVHGQ